MSRKGKVMSLANVVRGSHGSSAGSAQTEGDILKGLNPEQREVVLHHEGPLLAVAVAGAGKTAAIVRRMAYLVRIREVSPGRILAVTFSRKGADEMNERLEGLIGESDARVGTFHSLGLEIVKKEIGMEGWTVDDRDRYRIAIKDAVGYKEMKWDKADVTLIASFIGLCKANLARPFSEEAIEIAQGIYRSNPRQQASPQRLNQAYEVAERLRRDRRLITFDDMLFDSVELFQKDETVRARWASKWDYVIQDEAQDQNLAQLMMGELLAKDHRNYCLVGDPAQCIYTWRGAQPKKLLGFEQSWGAKVVQMGRNYRCGSVIIDAANKSLGSMDPTQRLPISMIAERGVTGEVVAKIFEDLDCEGEEIAEKVMAMAQDGAQYSDFVVLYRTNAQSRAVEEAMLSARIPYRIIGGTNFYERREVRGLISYLRLADGRGTVEDIERCINAPFRYLGRAFVDRVTDAAKLEQDNKGSKIDWTALVRNVCLQEGIQTRQKESAYEWSTLIDSIAKRIRLSADQSVNEEIRNAGKPSRLIEEIVHVTRYTAWLEKDEGEETTENSRVSNVREMIRAAGRFPTVKELLDYIDNVGKKAAKARKDKAPNKVTLTTLHRSKGLEWPTVFLCGVSDGILPHARCEDVEEERRLFYVGVTRARDLLHISSVLTLSLGSKVIMSEPSRFVSEAGISMVKSEARVMKALPMDIIEGEIVEEEEEEGY